MSWHDPLFNPDLEVTLEAWSFNMKVQCGRHIWGTVKDVQLRTSFSQLIVFNFYFLAHSCPS
jgi:hypothetical protein